MARPDKGVPRAAYTPWREALQCDVQTIALAGCGRGECLYGSPPELCARCNSEIIRVLAIAAFNPKAGSILYGKVGEDAK